MSIDFDRDRIQRQLKIYGAIVIAWYALLVLPLCLRSFTVFHTFWGELLLLLWLTACLSFCNVFAYLTWLGVLRSCLKRRGAALAVNKEGIVVNATGYPLGQLFWTDIEKIYPADVNLGFSINRWKQSPGNFRQRGVVVLLKDGVDLQSRYKSAWRLTAAFQNKSCQGKNRWLFIPELMLTATADDLIVRLNEFYIAQVRDPH